MLGSDPTVVVRVGMRGRGHHHAGDLFTRIAARAGLGNYSFQTYPAEIRGGQVMYQTRLGSGAWMTEGDVADVLVAMNQQAWAEELEDLCDGAVIVHEATVSIPSVSARTLTPSCREDDPGAGLADGQKLVFLGALTWFFRFDCNMAEALIRQRMRRPTPNRGEEPRSVRRGYRYARDAYPEPFPLRSPVRHDTRGALPAFGAERWPSALLPAAASFSQLSRSRRNPVMESLARYLRSSAARWYRSGDEFAAINMAIGASYAGQLSMTATSGPGLSLMVEGLGLASMAKSPWYW